VIEMEGEGLTKDGRPYNDHYCFWVKVSEGKIFGMRRFIQKLT